MVAGTSGFSSLKTPTIGSLTNVTFSTNVEGALLFWRTRFEEAQGRSILQVSACSRVSAVLYSYNAAYVNQSQKSVPVPCNLAATKLLTNEHKRRFDLSKTLVHKRTQVWNKFVLQDLE